MSRILNLLIPGLVVVLVLAGVVFWVQGGGAMLAGTALEAQRGFQTQMAQGLRALRAGEPGALAALWGVCFAYGFLHAIGPGHGKFLLGAYGAGTRAPLGRMVGLGLSASLAQGGVAIALVYGGVLIFDASRDALQLASDVWLERASLLAIALIGLWLLGRATRKVLRQTFAVPAVIPAGPGLHLRTGQGFGAPGPAFLASGSGRARACDSCGHRHAPDLHDVMAVQGWRDAALLVGAIAIRPCTGALFVLILTWRMGLVWQGMLAVMVMALGTAAVSVTVAASAVLARESALRASGVLARSRQVLPWIEGLAGLFILLTALSLLKLA